MAGHLLSLLFCRKGEAADFYPRRLEEMEVVDVLQQMKTIVEDDAMWNWPLESDDVLLERISYAHLPNDCDADLYLVLVKNANPNAVRNSISETVEKCLGVKCRMGAP
jgi:hypothetical protein